VKLTREERIAKWKTEYQAMKEWEQEQLGQLEFIIARAQKSLEKYKACSCARENMVRSLEQSLVLIGECHDLMERYFNIPYEDCDYSDLADKIRQAVLWDECVFQLNHYINLAIDFSLVVLEINKNSLNGEYTQDDVEEIQDESQETREAFSSIQSLYQNIAAKEFKMYETWLRNNGHRNASELFFGLYFSVEKHK
jgi:hypothetical protein